MTRTQFIASICAIPFIGKLLKPKVDYRDGSWITHFNGKNLVTWNGRVVDFGEIKKASEVFAKP